MYACELCNRRKSDLFPSQNARIAGHRFYRPDKDMHSDHFGGSGRRIHGLTNTGEFTNDAVDLNRKMLQRIREMRTVLYDSSELATQGKAGLKSLRIDTLPIALRSKAVAIMNSLADKENSVAVTIDEMLKTHAKSPLLDEDSDSDGRKAAARGKIASLRAMYPGTWSGSRS